MPTQTPTPDETPAPTPDTTPSPVSDETPSPAPDPASGPTPPQFTALPLPSAQAPPPPAGTVIQPPFDAQLDAIVRVARSDLAARRSLAVDDVEVVEVRSVVWPDGGLGCPHPDMLYPQVQVDGIFIRLRAAGGTFDYHGGGGRPPFLCEQGVRG